MGSFFAFIGLYVCESASQTLLYMLIDEQAPFFYVQSYVLAYDIMSESMSFYLLTILNACSTFGRLFPNILADWIGPLNVLSMPCFTNDDDNVY